MAPAKTEIDNIKKLIKENKLIIGTEKTIKELKHGNLEKVYLSKNTPADVVEDINYYSKLTNISVIQLELANDEIGILCKKSFSISVMGVLRNRNE
ncbi:ribosomal L7Ae/L30e/S12e/Gadd45 family protein [Candidatus Woesearchaeota archaeon]|nr:ribosomal L7Ae/L30e/S12e/Gadd45 family protein [Candidatus Woesearchaeota archaeon]